MKIWVETERLILREIVESDEDALFELDSNPEVHQYLGKNPVTEIAQIKELIRFTRQQYHDFGIGRWAAIEKKSGQMIGWAGLKFRAEPMHGYANYHDVGYRLMKKYWGQGFATEAGKASVRYGFEKMGLGEIHGMAHIENKASRNALEKIGLQYVQTVELENLPCDWLTITRNEWSEKNIADS